MRKFVYQFSEGSKEMKNLLGGKGANLAEMTNIGLPVPPGFIISTDACNDYTANNKHLSEAIFDEVKIHLAELEKQTGKFWIRRKSSARFRTFWRTLFDAWHDGYRAQSWVK